MSNDTLTIVESGGLIRTILEDVTDSATMSGSTAVYASQSVTDTATISGQWGVMGVAYVTETATLSGALSLGAFTHNIADTASITDSYVHTQQIPALVDNLTASDVVGPAYSAYVVATVTASATTTSSMYLLATGVAVATSTLSVSPVHTRADVSSVSTASDGVGVKNFGTINDSASIQAQIYKGVTIDTQEQASTFDAASI